MAKDLSSELTGRDANPWLVVDITGEKIRWAATQDVYAVLIVLIFGQMSL